MGKKFISLYMVLFLLVSSSVCGAAPVHYSQDVSLQQIKAQITLFNEALDQFGATSPSDAAKLWAKGFQRRNGAMQYSVFCDKLKKKFIQEHGAATDSLWVIGVSSPWLHKYAITKSKKLGEASYEITMKLSWVAVGYYRAETKTLSILKEKDKWCIVEIK